MTKGYATANEYRAAQAKQQAADETIEAVKAQRVAHDAYCAALEAKITLLEAELAAQNGSHMLTYTFLGKQSPELVDKYVEHCLSCDFDEWRVGIPKALDGLDEYSEIASKWADERMGRV